MSSMRILPLFLLLPAAVVAQDNADVPKAWREFQVANGAAWTAEWNPATGTPEAIYGQGLKVADRLATLASARARSEAVLADHADLLGRGDSTFVERTGTRIRHLYYFVYKQQYKGLDVRGGRADTRINTRGVVAMFGSTAVPIPKGFSTQPAIAADVAMRTAWHEVAAQAPADDAVAPRLVIWADTHAKTPTTPRLAWKVQILVAGTTTAGAAFVDAVTGAYFDFEDHVHYCAVCNKNHVRHAHRKVAAPAAAKVEVVPAAKAGQMALTGTVMGWCNTSGNANAALTNVPLGNLLVTSSAGNAYTDAQGKFSIPYTGTAAVLVSATLQGRYSRRVRVSQGTQLAASSMVTPGTAATIQFGTSTMGEFDRSQTTTYYWTNDTWVFSRGEVPANNSQFNTLAGMNPRVNISSSCNAYYTGYTTNFYASSSSCNNTAFSSVIIHEWGHGFDDAWGSINRTDGLSEGWADVLSIARLMDPVVGRFFQKNGGIVRTATNTRTYPVNSTSVHTQGQVWMGWFWDLRNNLVASKGQAAGEALAIDIVIPTIVADSSNMAAQIRSVFLQDDDDGNLNNGTPNYADLEKACIKRTVPYPKKVNPNAGSYVLFGKGCPGSGKLPGGTCQSDNTSSTSRTTTGFPGVIYLLELVASQSLDVAGYELLTRSSRTGNVTVTTHLYSASGNAPGTQLATGTMTIGQSAGWYKTTFNRSVTFAQGTRYFIGFTNSNPTFNLGTVTSGNITPYWRNNGTGGSWIRFTTRAWGYRVTCKGTQGGAIPTLSSSGLPELNQKFQLSLSNANPSANGFLVLGASDKLWGSTALPLDFSNVGATGCALYASADILIPLKTDTSRQLQLRLHAAQPRVAGRRDVLQPVRDR